MKSKPMRSIWQSLLWKEWHEHKWKLLGLTGLVAAITVLLSELTAGEFNASGQANAMAESLYGTLLGFCILGGVFLGMRTGGYESGRGTLAFLRTLPVSMRKPAAVKLLLATLTCVLPIVVTVVLVYFLTLGNRGIIGWVLLCVEQGTGPFGNWGLSSWPWALSVAASLGTVSLMLWMAAIGCHFGDEIRAGAIGFLVVALVWLIFGAAGQFAMKRSFYVLERATQIAVTAAPAGPAFINPGRTRFDSYWPHAICMTVVHSGLVFWYLTHFGKAPSKPRRNPAARAMTGAQAYWLASPRRSRLGAIVWKQCYETAPLVLFAVAAILLFTTLYFQLELEQASSTSIGEVIHGVSMMAGALVALVAGIGVFLDDVKPGVNVFWRSRPIDATPWFFVKFFTGLLIVVGMFAGLLFTAISLMGNRSFFYLGNSLIDISFVLTVFAIIYTLSTLCYCSCRQPIMAAITAMTLFFIGVYLFSEIFQGTDHPVWVLLVTLGATQLIVALAWLAVRNNWGCR